MRTHITARYLMFLTIIVIAFVAAIDFLSKNTRYFLPSTRTISGLIIPEYIELFRTKITGNNILMGTILTISIIIQLTSNLVSIKKISIVRHFLNNIITFLTPKKAKSISYWREYFFNAIFFFLMIINSIVFIASAIRLML